MAQSIEQCLLQAIKKDDRKAFDALDEKARGGVYRLGRFPVLSLLYLYKSRAILSAYEDKLLAVSVYEQLREPVEVSKKFSAKAGKCLRLYFNEVVTPLEMLLILDKTKRLKRVYPLTKPSEKVKKRLKLIYSIRYSLEIKFEGDGIIIDRRPLSYREKKNIIAACLCSVLAVALVVGVPVTTVALIPEPVEGEVKKLSQIDFTSKEEYTLKCDLVLPEDYSVEKVNCKLNGEGHKLILSKGTTFGEFNGKLSDVIIESAGEAVFTSVSENATIQNVTVNVNADIISVKEAALVAVTNYGTIDGVTVNVSGNIKALASGEEVSSELIFGGIVLYNTYKTNSTTQKIGTVKNCTVNYSHLELVGEASANAVFGGVAGINNGYLQDCTVNGEIVADTFDIAGVCFVNNGVLKGNINEANLLQTTSDTGWNPITCGIVLSNTYAVENCENRGKVSAVSNCGQFEVQEGTEPTASASGIAYVSRGSSTTPYIINCTNSGKVESVAKYRNTYAAGVCLSSSGQIQGCKNSGEISCNADNGLGTYVGGITTIAYGNVVGCESDGKISAIGSGTAYVGGISAHSNSRFTYCLSSGDIAVEANAVYVGGIFGFSDVASDFIYVYRGTADNCISECNINVTAIGETPAYVGGIAGYIREDDFNSGKYYGGWVTSCYFTGKCISGVSHFGNIVGVYGANIYESNNFEGNYYTDNTFNAFGTTVTAEGEFIASEDKCAECVAPDDIKNLQGYIAILAALENKEELL